MKYKSCIINGIIYNEKQEVIFGAIIKITEIDPTKNTYNILAYTQTDINGYYFTEVDTLEDKFYEITIYPLLGY